MVKKLFSLLLSVLLVFSSALTAFAEGEPTPLPPETVSDNPEGLFVEAGVAELIAPADDAVQEISDAKGLFSLSGSSGRFVLTDNIDMSGIEWTPCAFSGTLDGAGYCIYNLSVSDVGGDMAKTVDGNNKSYDTCFAGLFSVLKGAVIRDLTLRGADIHVETQEHCFIGALAGMMENTTLTNCTVLDTQLMLTAARESLVDGKSFMAGVGGLVGFGGGTVKGCETDVTLLFYDKSGSDLRCEQYMGGILGCGNADILDCRVTLDGYDECHGYVHNGGLIGMFYQYDKSAVIGSVRGCDVKGQITFFENNPDRRAYCQAYAGEFLTWAEAIDCTDAFTANEVFDYEAILTPEKCSDPQLDMTVTEPTCTEWGYTEYACKGCGNSRRTDFVPPTHTEGEWTVTTDATYEESGVLSLLCAVCGEVMEEKALAPHVAGEWVTESGADYEHTGLRRLYCTDCGALLEEETLPLLVRSSECRLSAQELSMTYRETDRLYAELYPENAANDVVYWTSSDESVVSVETNGTLHAEGRGTAVITCASADGGTESYCTVKVGYSPLQWVIVILCFGWAWY